MRVERCVCCEQVHCRPKYCSAQRLGHLELLAACICAQQNGGLLALSVESRAHRDVA